MRSAMEPADPDEAPEGAGGRKRAAGEAGPAGAAREPRTHFCGAADSQGCEQAGDLRGVAL